MEAVLKPEALKLMIVCGTSPSTWETWTYAATDRDGWARAAKPFMAPETYLRWARAPVDREVHASVNRIMRPNTGIRWWQGVFDTNYYQSLQAFADPNWFAERMQWMMNPNSYKPFLEAMTVPVVTETRTATEE